MSGRLVAAFALVAALGASPACGAPDLPLAAIGKVTHAGFSSRGQCTGVLIAPARVLTAAHCLASPVDGRPVPLGDIHFLPGYDRGTYLANARARAVAFAPGYVEAGDDDHRLLADAAIIDLVEPLDIAAPALFLGVPDADMRVVAAGYVKTRSEVPTLTEPCHVLPLRSGLWASDCPAAPGGSGGPVFALTDTGPLLAGIVVAVTGTGLTYVVPLSLVTVLLAP